MVFTNAKPQTSEPSAAVPRPIVTTALRMLMELESACSYPIQRQGFLQSSLLLASMIAQHFSLNVNHVAIRGLSGST